MCGIVGLVSKWKNGFVQSDTDLFTQMLVADSVRGTDGTGVFGVYGSGSVNWQKVASHPYALVTNPKYEAWRNTMTRKFNMVVGHNRKATAGSKTHENAHPFVHEHIILVHNGMVHDHKKMADTDVDSHAIAHSIVEKGHKEALATLQGAFALVWFDMKTRTLHMVRNSQRPLYIVETASHIAFASEGYMLMWIGKRNDKDWKDIKQLEEGMLVSISQETREITSEKIPLYTYQPPAYSYMEEYGWHGCYARNHNAHMSHLPTTVHTEDEDTDLDPVGTAISNSMPETDEVDEQEVVEFVNKYKDGQIILFQPNSVFPWTSHVVSPKGFSIIGFLRGNTDIEVRGYIEGANAKEYVDRLVKRQVLKGTVYGVSVNPTTMKKIIQVSHISEMEVYRTFNGTYLTSEEWINLCDTSVCNKCFKKVKIADVERASVNKKDADKVKLFCADCVETHLKTLPPEQQETIRKINIVNEIVDQTDKEWNLKGTTHGS